MIEDSEIREGFVLPPEAIKPLISELTTYATAIVLTVVFYFLSNNVFWPNEPILNKFVFSAVSINILVLSLNDFIRIRIFKLAPRTEPWSARTVLLLYDQYFHQRDFSKTPYWHMGAGFIYLPTTGWMLGFGYSHFISVLLIWLLSGLPSDLIFSPPIVFFAIPIWIFIIFAQAINFSRIPPKP